MVASRDGSRNITLHPHPSADQSGDNTCNFKEFSQDIPSHRLADIPPLSGDDERKRSWFSPECDNETLGLSLLIRIICLVSAAQFYLLKSTHNAWWAYYVIGGARGMGHLVSGEWEPAALLRGRRRNRKQGCAADSPSSSSSSSSRVQCSSSRYCRRRCPGTVRERWAALGTGQGRRGRTT